MANPQENSLENFVRMSEQTHPDILPLCVETLEAEVIHAREKTDTIENIYHDDIKTTYRSLGTIMLGAGVFEAQFFAINAITDIRTVNSASVLIAGAAIFGWRLMDGARRTVKYGTALNKSKRWSEKISGLYDTAQNRLIENSFSKTTQNQTETVE